MDHAFLYASLHLLAGTSIFFYARKHTDTSRFLLIRGAWLIFLELTVLRISWTFNFDFAHYEMAGILWVIGWCMILMAGLVKLPLPIALLYFACRWFADLKTKRTDWWLKYI